MLNAWDFLFALILLAFAWLGWRLKSLRLLGAGFAVALAPWLAGLWNHSFGSLLVEKLGGSGLKPNEDEVAWWVLAILCGLALIFLFSGLSKMLAALKLEFLDRGFGALMTAGIFAALLGLNLVHLALKLDRERRVSLRKSWSWAHLRVSKEPAWLEDLEKKAESLK